ncbi:MAG: hypothetical protein ACR2H9_18515 [Longimicrobiaceae bacterium]
MSQTTIPPALLERIEQAAEKNGVTPVELLEGWLEREEKDRNWQALLGYGQRRAAELGITEGEVERLIEESRREARGR